jgi:hypothetical protein
MIAGRGIERQVCIVAHDWGDRLLCRSLLGESAAGPGYESYSGDRYQ